MDNLRKQIINRTRLYARIEKMREAREVRKQKLIQKNHYVEGHNETYVKDGEIRIKRN